MAIVDERMTHNELQGAVARFGFGRKTGCGLGGESPGLVTNSANWNHYTQTSVPVGHEIAVTPMQMTTTFGRATLASPQPARHATRIAASLGRNRLMGRTSTLRPTR